MTHDDHPEPSIGDIYYEAFYSAAIGGAVIALFFLAIDVFGGRPLFTPSLLGTVLFTDVDAQAVDTIRYDMMAWYTVIHLVSFGALGLVATPLVRWVEERTGGSAIAPFLVLFALVGGGFFVGAGLLMPGVVAVLGSGMVLLASALTAAAMTAFLRNAHDTSETQAAASDPGGVQHPA